MKFSVKYRDNRSKAELLKEAIIIAAPGRIIHASKSAGIYEKSIEQISKIFKPQKI
jgi:hypothetical protein